MKVAREAVWKFAGATKPRGGDRLQSSSELKWYQRPVRMMRLDYLDALDRMKNADLDALARSKRDEWHINCEWIVGTPGIAPGLGFLTTFDTPKFGKYPALGDFDMLRDYLPHARKYGIHVLAYLNMHWFAYDFADAHPGWEQICSDGVAYGRRNPLYGGGTTLCVNGGWRDWAIEMVGEAMKTGIDGVFLDGPVFFPDTCYCDACKAQFAARYGKDIPTVEDWSNPDWSSFVEFRSESLARFLADCRKAVKSVREDGVCFLNAGSWQASTWRYARSIDAVGPFEDFNGAEAFFHPGPRDHALLMWTATAKYMAAGDKPAIVFSHHALGAWHYIPLPNYEAQLGIAQTVACGANPWIAVFDYALDHSRADAVEPIDEIQGFLADNEEYYTATESCADVALLNSSQTTTYYVSDRGEFYGDFGSGKEENLVADLGGGAKQVDWKSRKQTCEAALDNSYMGYLSALTRSHIPFDVVLDSAVSREGLARYKVLILPNSACLSDAQIEGITEFARRGGAVVAEFETGAYDELGRRRAANPLLGVLGVSELGRMMRPSSNEEYVRVLEGHPALGDLQPGRLLARPTYSLRCRAAADASTPTRFMNEVGGSYKPLKGESDVPALVLTSRSGGRTAYIPSLLGDFYGRFKILEGQEMIASVVRWARVDPLPIAVDCPPTVEVELRRASDGRRLLVHLVNNTGDMQRPISQIIPIRDVRVRLRCDAPTRVRALRADTDLTFAYNDGQVEFTLPELGVYELVVAEVANS